MQQLWWWNQNLIEFNFHQLRFKHKNWSSVKIFHSCSIMVGTQFTLIIALQKIQYVVYQAPASLLFVFLKLPLSLYFVLEYNWVTMLWQSEVRESDSPSSVFLSQDCFCYLGSFVCLHRNLKIFYSSVKNAIGNLIGIGWICLTILILPTHKHGISFHMVVSSSISFISILEFSGYMSLSP